MTEFCSGVKSFFNIWSSVKPEEGKRIRNVKPNLNEQAVVPKLEFCQWLDNWTYETSLSTIPDKHSQGSSTAVNRLLLEGSDRASWKDPFCPLSLRPILDYRACSQASRQQYCCWIVTLYSLLTACNSLSCSEDFLATEKKTLMQQKINPFSNIQYILKLLMEYWFSENLTVHIDTLSLQLIIIFFMFILVTYPLDCKLPEFVSLRRLMYRTYRNILVQRKFRYGERAKRGLNEAVEWIINVDFIDTLKGANTNTMVKA